MPIPTFKSHLRGEPVEENTITLTPSKDGLVSEVTPPGMEDWVKKNKKRFEKEYGEKASQVLYATAWDMYEKGKRVNESWFGPPSSLSQAQDVKSAISGIRTHLRRMDPFIRSLETLAPRDAEGIRHEIVVIAEALDSISSYLP